MSEYGFLINVSAALLAALLGGLLARLLRLPVLIGYLAAGVAVGPHTPGFFADEAAVYSVAKLGAALLMFAGGLQVSLKEMAGIKATAVGAGGIQILGTILLGIGVGLAFGWGTYGAVYLGCAMALTSTTVMMRVLEERGEGSGGHGAVMLGISVVQDLALVVMVAVLPATASLSTEGAAALGGVAVSVLRALLLVSVALYLALRGAPYVLEGVARTGIRELFVLTVVCLCLTAAYGAHKAGLSFEIGAFLAGLAIAESRYAHEVLSQVRPLRDLFASLFFVSVGMLWNPSFLVGHWGLVGAVVLAILLGKGLIAALAVFAFGWHGRTAILAGAGLAQIGEFSFVLAAIGTERGLIPETVSGVVLSAALLTIVAAPFTYAGAAPLYAWLNRFPAASRLLNGRHPDDPLSARGSLPAARVIILGSGRVGRQISDALKAHKVPHVVVDYNTKVVAHRRRAGVPAIFGDASSDVVLAQTNPHAAELAIVTLPDAGAAQAAIRCLKRLAPELPILARVHRGPDIEMVRRAGADGVVHAEFEASVRLIRLGLDRLGFSDEEIDLQTQHLRARRYRQAACLDGSQQDR